MLPTLVTVRSVSYTHLSADYQELTRLLGEKEEAEAALMDLMEQWEQAQA